MGGWNSVQSPTSISDRLIRARRELRGSADTVADLLHRLPVGRVQVRERSRKGAVLLGKDVLA
jgi:hypothetical protein